MRESKVEDYLIDRVKRARGEVRKLKYIGHRSATDRLVLLPGRAFMCELKRPGIAPTSEQRREHAKLRWAGVPVEVIDSIESVDEVLKRYGC